MNLEQEQQTFRLWFGAGAVVVAFAIVLVLVMFTAARQAGFIVAEADRKLIGQEIERELERSLIWQSDLSFWDETVAMLEANNAEADLFWQEELVDWFTVDTGFKIAAVIEPDGEIHIAADDGHQVDGATIARDVRRHSDLITAARARFDANKEPAGTGYLMPGSLSSDVPDLGAAAYRYFGSAFGIVTAQVIVGETADYAVQLDRLHVLMTFTPIDEAYVTDFAEGLGLNTDHVVLVPNVPIMMQSPHMVPFSNLEGEPEVYFHWRPQRLDHLIILYVAPFAALSFLLLVTALVIPLRAHSKALVLLAKSEAMNRQMANHDALTGLPNRAQFDRKLDQLLADASGDPFAVVCMDLDRFKAVNDNYGHIAGDAVLKTVATRLTRIIGDKGLIARVGGDEFIALISEDVHRDHLTWLGESLIDEATSPIPYLDNLLTVGCSIGISIWPRDGRTACEIIAAADGFLYESKRSGRGRVTIGGVEPAVTERTKMAV